MIIAESLWMYLQQHVSLLPLSQQQIYFAKTKHINIVTYRYIKKKLEYHEKDQYFFVTHFRKWNPYII